MSTHRTITGAHYGLRDWLAQRITGAVLAVYSIVLVLSVLLTPDLDYGSWAGLFASTWMKVFTLVALLSLIWHAWIGIRDIYMDYIKPTAIRLFLEVLTVVALVGYGCWAVIILWRV